MLSLLTSLILPSRLTVSDLPVENGSVGSPNP